MKGDRKVNRFETWGGAFVFLKALSPERREGAELRRSSSKSGGWLVVERQESERMSAKEQLVKAIVAVACEEQRPLTLEMAAEFQSSGPIDRLDIAGLRRLADRFLYPGNDSRNDSRITAALKRVGG